MFNIPSVCLCDQSVGWLAQSQPLLLPKLYYYIIGLRKWTTSIKNEKDAHVISTPWIRHWAIDFPNMLLLVVAC